MPQNPAPDGVFLLPVCTTKENLVFILAAITAYGRIWPKEARNSQYDILEALAFIENPSEAGCVEGLGMRLRQNPDDLCQLQQQQNGDWVTVFDYGLCSLFDDGFTGIEIALELEIAFNLIQELKEAFDGDPESVAPDINLDADLREKVLCAALTVLLEGLIAAEVRRRQNDQTLLDFFSSLSGNQALVVALGVAAGVLTAGGAWVAMAAGLLSLGTAAWSALIGIEIDDLTDPEAKEEAICCVYSAVSSGDFPDRSQLAAAAESCAVSLDSPASLLASVLSNVFSLGDDAYLGFLNYADKLRDSPQVANFICPCVDAWEHVFDFTTGVHGWVLDEAEQGTPIGQWENSIGWTHDTASFPDGATRRGVNAIVRYFPETLITFVDVICNRTAGTTTSAGTARILSGNVGNNLFQGNFFFYPFGNNISTSWAGEQLMSRLWTFHFCSISGGSGSQTIHTVVVRGRGTNPFI